MTELKEFITLKNELFGKDLFVVLDETDPKVKRYNELLPMFLNMIKQAKGM